MKKLIVTMLAAAALAGCTMYTPYGYSQSGLSLSTNMPGQVVVTPPQQQMVVAQPQPTAQVYMNGAQMQMAGPQVQMQTQAYAPPAQSMYVQSGGTSMQVNMAMPQMQLGSGVTTMQVNCNPSAPEQCNGIDDNCNGAIDEGCGYQTGALQITLAWNTGADIDLYVNDPVGESLNFGSTSVASGGVLDHDARGNCTSSNGPGNVENVYWSQNPPHGTYNIELNNFSSCGLDIPMTSATVSVAYGGRVIGVYNVPIVQSAGRIPVAAFSL